ncbi:MAG TPA: thiamine pyrophosphate-dependent enzyme [Acidimicrobiales bacterium]|jgi:2-oxoglutarate ferredoxin oxidoreductase subunit beta|nr:thiamine pyrophosphate-dependent enzyme [Acidimicrobiales bacterium]
MTVVPTDAPPEIPSTKIASAMAPLQMSNTHHLCAGCGHPIAFRLLLEVLSELSLETLAIGTAGHGCYTMIATISDIEFVQCLHGRSPAVATGIKRVQPGAVVFSVQGDGDLASEGLHEILHAGGRGEKITCIMLNNGVFGDTGGQMTGSTVIGQRTKTSVEGRDPELHGYPIPVGNLLAQLPGVAYVARGAVNNAGSIAQTKKFLKRAFETQLAGKGLSFVEILTMCPTGWFMPTAEGPTYLAGTIEQTFPVGQLKAPSGIGSTEA